MRPQHAVEYCSVFPFIQISGSDCDHRRPTGLILKNAGVVHSLCKAWPIVIDIKDSHQDLMCTNTEIYYQDRLRPRW